jgi:hypothetical protein
MFKTFAAAVAAKYDNLAKRELFVVDVEDLFASYLAAFPEGTDPIYRVRTVHDCNADKNFIRRLGNVVAIYDDGHRESVWTGMDDMPYPYNEVARRLNDVVLQAPIVSVFRTKERSFGSAPNWDNHDTTIRWEHFLGKVATRHLSATPDKARGDINTTAQVLRRGLEELNVGDFETVLDLIEAKALYRGAEHVASIKGFRDLQRDYLSADDRNAFIWANLDNRNARFRNTVIGTLLTDLADGTELEQAVKKFEAKVAPENYKRPTALITPKMIEQAVAKLAELGLEHAVDRRYATIEDVSVNDVLFVDNEVRGKMKGGLADLLMGSTKVKAATVSKDATPISIEAFMALPKKSVELVIANSQQSNFVSLTAPVYDDGGQLFKWSNGFAWMYDGELADTGMKERVKAAGGRVDGAMRVSLGWFNGDDLDLHCDTPDRQHIAFYEKRGILDVDMNAGAATNRTNPVENMAWKVMPRDGEYKFTVNQYSRRYSENEGFRLEIEVQGALHELSYPKGMRTGENVSITLTIANGQLAGIKHGTGMTNRSVSTEKWGVKTLTPVRVDTIMTSPNFWEGAGDVGNKHWFFMLEGCKNPDATRGFVNEFLRGSLDPHRKVFEVLSSKTKCPPSDSQLSGVGFSSTRGDKVIAIADGRTYEVQF